MPLHIVVDKRVPRSFPLFSSRVNWRNVNAFNIQLILAQSLPQWSWADKLKKIDTSYQVKKMSRCVFSEESRRAVIQVCLYLYFDETFWNMKGREVLDNVLNERHTSESTSSPINISPSLHLPRKKRQWGWTHEREVRDNLQWRAEMFLRRRSCLWLSFTGCVCACESEHVFFFFFPCRSCQTDHWPLSSGLRRCWTHTHWACWPSFCLQTL